MKARLNMNIQQYLTLEGASCWLQLYLELTCDLILVVAMAIIVLARGYITASYAALTLSYAIWLPEMVYWFVLCITYLENQMVSVERLDVLIKIEGEAPRKRHIDGTLTNWPTAGEIEFKDL
jgi:hypothetical protein